MQQLSRKHAVMGLLALSLVSSLAKPEGIGFMRSLAAPLLTPFSHALLYLSTRVEGNVDDLLTGVPDPAEVQRLRQENESLKNAAASYEGQIARLQEQATDVSAWHGALDRDFPCALIPATVIAEDGAPYNDTRTLRTGRGVEKGARVTTRSLAVNRPTEIPSDLAVVSSSALVGRIVSAGAWTASLQLVTDPDFETTAMVKRIVNADKPRTIETDNHASRPLRNDDPMISVNLRGQGKGMVSAEVPAYHNIAAGDYVVSMGNDWRLPLGVMIGHVIAAVPVPNNPTHVWLEVAPSADLSHLYNVYVIMPKSLSSAGGK